MALTIENTGSTYTMLKKVSESLKAKTMQIVPAIALMTLIKDKCIAKLGKNIWQEYFLCLGTSLPYVNIVLLVAFQAKVK